MIVDSRTASPGGFLTAVLRRAALEAQDAGVLKLGGENSWATLVSSLRSIGSAEWAEERGPLVVFFDQFENVFRDIVLTRDFRDLALAVRETPGRLMIGSRGRPTWSGGLRDTPISSVMKSAQMRAF